MKGGYSAVARHLTARTGHEITRMQVFLWNQRRTLNATGQPFPSPVESVPGAKPRQPRLLFDFGQVMRWYRAGAPPAQSPQTRKDHARARQAAGI
jgi:hypothetical protein